MCSYGSDERKWIKDTSESSDSDCQSTCNSTSSCTAVAYLGSNGRCILYKGGPYTYADNDADYMCYVMPGILINFLMVEIYIYVLN